jgi:hypothetical protein
MWSFGSVLLMMLTMCVCAMPHNQVLTQAHNLLLDRLRSSHWRHLVADLARANEWLHTKK